MNYFIAALLIGFLILLHELGHFIAARCVNIPVSRFSIGFGPKLWGFKRGNTEYRLSLFPFGGYVLPEIEDLDQFYQIPFCQRVIYLIGGPVTNIILPLFLFGILNMTLYGFSLAGVFIKPFFQTLGLLYDFICALPLLFFRPDQLSGIIGIVAQGGQLVGNSILDALRFSILLSLNLAILNLLPIPPLDGGKIILYLLEKAHPKMQRIHFPLAIAGGIFILCLMVYATILDFGKYFTGLLI